MPSRVTRYSAVALSLATLLLAGCETDEVISPPTLTGSIEASLAMTGAAPDADGCRVAVGIAGAQILLDGESHVFSNLSTGTHTVTITDVASNCTVEGETSRSISVSANDTTSVSFTIECQEPGRIEVTTVTAGSIDPDGYVAALGQGPSRGIGVNDAVTFSGLAAGEYDVRLTGLADNCRVTGENPVTVIVSDTKVSHVDFDVACPPFYDQIAFESDRDGGGDIYIVRADGSNTVRLTYGGSAFEPAWSPDGTRIAFTGFPPGASYPEIFVMGADGSNPVNVTLDPDIDDVPAWSPDGGRIAFTSYRDYDPGVIGASIFTMGADGSNPTKVVTANCVSWPAWSPDGLRIAYNAPCAGENGYDIYVVNTDGSNPTNLTNHIGDDFSPAWSPDGTRIAFNGNRDGAKEIYVMDADGSNVVQLTDNDFTDWFPAWSPDGQWIAFVSCPNDSCDIFVMDTDGGNLVRVTDHPAHDSRPTWSPAQ